MSISDIIFLANFKSALLQHGQTPVRIQRSLPRRCHYLSLLELEEYNPKVYNFIFHLLTVYWLGGQGLQMFSWDELTLAPSTH